MIMMMNKKKLRLNTWKLDSNNNKNKINVKSSQSRPSTLFIKT